jgi:hypothetical protein
MSAVKCQNPEYCGLSKLVKRGNKGSRRNRHELHCDLTEHLKYQVSTVLSKGEKRYYSVILSLSLAIAAD